MFYKSFVSELCHFPRFLKWRNAKSYIYIFYDKNVLRFITGNFLNTILTKNVIIHLICDNLLMSYDLLKLIREIKLIKKNTLQLHL